MRHQQLDDSIAGVVRVSIQSQFGEPLVVTDKYRRWVVDRVEDPLQRRSIGWRLQIFHDVDLLTPFRQDFQRTPGLPARRVVVHANVGAGIVVLGRLVHGRRISLTATPTMQAARTTLGASQEARGRCARRGLGHSTPPRPDVPFRPPNLGAPTTPPLRNSPGHRPFATIVGALVAVVLLGAAFSGAQRVTAAGAEPIQDADSTVQSLRRAADDAAAAYFAALDQSQNTQRQIDQLEAQLPRLEAQAQTLRAEVKQRAAAAYVNRGNHDFSYVFSTNDALDAARRAKWLDALNARDDASLSDLTKVEAQLNDQRAELRRAQTTQQAAVLALQAQSTEINTKLQTAIDRLRSAQAAAARAAVVSRPVVPSGTGPGTSPSSPPPAPPADYQPTAGVHPHHDDPFLACTRGIESGGNYAAYNAAGPYLGAYQFLQSTWNSAANHAGRPELIGVPANTASQYDQDDVAWALYQWQGAGPWGGRCT